MFENGVPRPVWGDVFLASGLAVAGFELQLPKVRKSVLTGASRESSLLLPEA